MKFFLKSTFPGVLRDSIDSSETPSLGYEETVNKQEIRKIKSFRL